MPVFPYQSISETILNERNSIEACKKLESTTDFMSLPISIPSLAATCYRFLKQEISKINQFPFRNLDNYRKYEN